MLNKVLSSLIQSVFERYYNANFLRMPKFNIVVFKGHMFFKGCLLVIVCYKKTEKMWYFYLPVCQPLISYPKMMRTRHISDYCLNQLETPYLKEIRTKVLPILGQKVTISEDFLLVSHSLSLIFGNNIASVFLRD